MRYNEILEFLGGLSSENCAIERFNLTKFAFDYMYKNVDPEKIILVAGTNGKGTTSATLTALLRFAGKKVGLYTSPHLVSVNERINCGNDITNEEFERAFDYVHKNAEKSGIKLSHFEYLTLMAYYHFFVENSVDYAVFEVGLGGLYDATNVIPHKTCVLTKIGFDHERYLGNKLTDIAKNKFGIIQNNSGQKVIHLPFDKEVKKLTDDIEATFVECCQFDMFVDDEFSFAIETKYGKAKLALLGKRACENTALALTVFDELGYDPSKYLDCLAKVKWPGRMEKVVIDGRQVFLSGDHNEQGVDSLIEILSHFDYSNVHFIVGIANDKNYHEMLKKLSSVANGQIYLTETPYKTRPIKEYGEWLKNCAAYDANWEKLLNIIPKNDEDLVIITGSLYLVGLVKSKLEKPGK